MDFQVMGNRSLAGDAHFFEDSTSPLKVRQYLDSNKEADKLKGMKWLLAMLSKGRDVSEFFPDVVKNVIVKSIEVKKMVYNYLVHYADYDNSCREMALLSINSFQKDMSGSNQLIRGLALRVLTSIRVSDIIQIQLLAVRKCATDSSPYVRKCAATACTKIYSLDIEQLPQLQQLLDKLLKDNSTMVLGSAIAAFNEICPTSYNLLHRSYRKLCHLLADMDEWSQISCLDVLIRYSRNQFTDPAPGATAAARLQSKHRSASAIKGKLGTTVKRRIVKKAFYSDEEDELDEEDVDVDIEPINIHSALNDDENNGNSKLNTLFSNNVKDNDIEGDLDVDHRLVLRSAFPLLKSRNSGVVLGVCSLHYYCGSQGDRHNQQVGKALVRILRNHREIQYVVLTSIQTMARERPIIFRPFLSEFFVKSSDPVFNKLIKLEILTSICFKDNVNAILKELQVYIKNSNVYFVCATIKAIGCVVDCDPEVAGICMEGLMHLLLCSRNESIIGETVTVLCQLIQQNTSCNKTPKILFQLIKLLLLENDMIENDTGSNDIAITIPAARACIIWIIGEFYESIGKVSSDILRILTSGFINEATVAKLQILNYAVKLALRFPDDDTIQNLMTYVLEMSRYDVDTDLRDRSKFMTALMGLAPQSNDDSDSNTIDEASLEELANHAKKIMLASKLPPVTLLGSVDVEGLPYFTVGSLSSLVGHNALGYEPIAPWPITQPDPNVRDVLRLNNNETSAITGNLINGNSAVKGSNTGNNFYGSSESESESEESDSSSESESESEESDENSDDDDDDVDDEDEKPKEVDISSDDDSVDSDDDEDSSSESDEEVSRIPLTAQAKVSNLIRPGIRRVTGSSNSSVATVSTLIPADFGNTTLQPTNTFVSSTIPVFNTSGINHSTNGSSNDLENFLSGNASSQSITSNYPASNQPFNQSLGQPSLGQPQQYHQTYNQAFSQNTSINQQTSLQYGQKSSTQPIGQNLMFSSPQQSTNLVDLDPFSSLSLSSPSNPSQSSYVAPQNMSLAQSLAQSSVATTTAPVASSLVSPISSMNTIGSTSLSKVVLKPELGGGLAVSVVFQFGGIASAIIGASVGFFSVKNMRDHPIRRIAISFPTDIRTTQFQPVAQLPPQQEIQIPFEIVLQGQSGKAIRIDIRSDIGSYNGLLIVEAAYLLTPIQISYSDFDKVRNQLRGLNEVIQNFSLSSLGFHCNLNSGLDSELISFIKKLAFIQSIHSSKFGEFCFAGELKSGYSDIRVLFTFMVDQDQLTLKCNCDDAMMATTFVTYIAKALYSRSS